jgi:hypothetical protein
MPIQGKFYRGYLHEYVPIENEWIGEQVNVFSKFIMKTYMYFTLSRSKEIRKCFHILTIWREFVEVSGSWTKTAETE